MRSWIWLSSAGLLLVGLCAAELPSKDEDQVADSTSQDSLTVLTDSTETQPHSAPLAPAMPKTRSDSLTIVKHGYQHRQQIITGSVVMACLALILVTMNNYNPR